MVHFPPFACSNLCIQRVIHTVCVCGFPHSEISGSTPVCGSPKLIAACHVLHRLILPRHPPCALSSLVIEFTRTQKPTLRRYPYAFRLLKTLNIHLESPDPRKQPAAWRLSLVVTITQSIQLSNITGLTPAHPGVQTCLERYPVQGSELSPSTSANALSFFREKIGGAARDRTVDPLLAKQVLSQLSYSPT
jgi:hypothetical protein